MFELRYLKFLRSIRICYSPAATKKLFPLLVRFSSLAYANLSSFSPVDFQNEYSALPFITPSIPIASFPVFQNQDKQSPESNHTSITMQQHQQTQNLRPLNAPSSTNVSKQFDNIESVMGAYATIKALTNDEIESGSDSAVGITDLDPSWLPEHGQFWLWNMGAFREEF